MRFVLVRSRAEWRRRWVSLLALTLLVALTGAVVLTALAGARRTQSTVERAAAGERTPDALLVFTDTTLAPAAAVAKAPAVAAIAPLAMFAFFSKVGYTGLAAAADGRLGRDVLRPRVLRGRRANPKRAFEIAVPESTAARLRVDVGDTFELAAPGVLQSACLRDDASQGNPACAATDELFARDTIPMSKLDGPHIEMRVVGITRGLLDVGGKPSDGTLNLLTPAFFHRYRDTVLWQPAALVRYSGELTDREFERALTRVLPRSAISDFATFESGAAALGSTVAILANGLLAFAAVVALVGLVMLVQALARQVTLGRNDRAVLATLGVTRAGRRIDALAPLVPVAVLGGALAASTAYGVLALMPIGLAARAESDPGRDFDGAVLIGGFAVLVALVLVAAAIVASHAANVGNDSSSLRSRLITHVAPPGVSAAVGLHFATDGGTGRRSVPVRSAFTGIALGVAGVVAVAVFGGSLARLGDDPHRQGWGWDVAVTGARSGEPELEGRADLASFWAQRIAADPDVVGVTQAWLGFQPRVAGRTVTGYAQRTFEGHAGFVVQSGRAPIANDEVALGATTARRAKTDIGRTVDVQGTRMRVVGTAVFPATNDGYALADGALFSASGAHALNLDASPSGSSPWNTKFAVQLRPGADRSAVLARLGKLNNSQPPTGPLPHTEITQLEQLSGLPWVLAAMLLAVALLAATHALVLTVRRRGLDLAVLRTLGFTPGQSRRTVAWQATTLAGVGALIGVPVGMIVGRLVWIRVADSYGIATDPAWPWFVVAIALPATVLLANGIAWVPGRRAARVRPAQVLRTE